MQIEKISITNEDINLLLTMEAGGFDYWGSIEYDDQKYFKAREEMKEKGLYDENRTCYEDVLTYMITETKYPVYVHDFEEDKFYRLTKRNIAKGFLLNAKNRSYDASLEAGDAITGDCILQYAIFGELIYG